ncbi:hypothetical protein QWZ10_15285 [Paracoccus cavernae]|uniref:Uncharacterized protein n=1 Tax=Paracoccus cavernae TaxID=1571207 RepID=A0ABT8DAA4_9RHOB|nr:hypothetical protein [Paracoccus cavernae]
MVTDPLPAGFEIDNPNLISAGDISQLSWLGEDTPRPIWPNSGKTVSRPR